MAAPRAEDTRSVRAAHPCEASQLESCNSHETDMGCRWSEYCLKQDLSAAVSVVRLRLGTISEEEANDGLTSRSHSDRARRMRPSRVAVACADRSSLGTLQPHCHHERGVEGLQREDPSSASRRGRGICRPCALLSCVSDLLRWCSASVGCTSSVVQTASGKQSATAPTARRCTSPPRTSMATASRQRRHRDRNLRRVPQDPCRVPRGYKRVRAWHRRDAWCTLASTVHPCGLAGAVLVPGTSGYKEVVARYRAYIK
jgi:hypothetical protein